jgi:hypothetical protein
MSDSRIDDRIIDRHDRRRLPGRCAAPEQPRDDNERLVSGGRDQLFANGPLEHAFDPGGVVVDVASAQPVVDHALPNGFQSEGAEVDGQLPPVPVTQILDAGLDGGRDPRAAAILAIVIAGKTKISGAEFDDGDRVAARWLEAPIALKPLGN